VTLCTGALAVKLLAVLAATLRQSRRESDLPVRKIHLTNTIYTVLANKRILIITNDAWFFVSHRLPIATALHTAQAQCHVVAHEDETVSKIETTGAAFHHWNISPRSTSIIKELQSVFHLARLIRKIDPDVIHLVTIKPVLYGGAFARLLRVKGAVFAISGMGHLFQDKDARSSPMQILAKSIYRFVLRHKNANVIVQNHSDKSFFTDTMKVPATNVYQLPGSGVDLHQFSVQDKTNQIPVVILTARMLWDKGVGYFVEAAKVINQNGQRARFVLVGLSDPNNPRSIPLAELDAWQKEGWVEYLGHRDDIPTLLATAEIYCLPTIYGEGLPKAILEAMACGCATIATDWPGCNEIIDDGHNGLLVAPKDTDALVTALNRLIDDAALRHQLGQAGRKTVETGYSVETVVEQTLMVYEKLITGSK